MRDNTATIAILGDRRSTLTALCKVADPEVRKAAAASLKQLAVVEKKLVALDRANAERLAMKALLDNATDDVTRSAIRKAMHARALETLNELVARDRAQR